MEPEKRICDCLPAYESFTLDEPETCAFMPCLHSSVKVHIRIRRRQPLLDLGPNKSLPSSVQANIGFGHLKSGKQVSSNR